MCAHYTYNEHMSVSCHTKALCKMSHHWGVRCKLMAVQLHCATWVCIAVYTCICTSSVHHMYSQIWVFVFTYFIDIVSLRCYWFSPFCSVLNTHPPTHHTLTHPHSCIKIM